MLPLVPSYISHHLSDLFEIFTQLATIRSTSRLGVCVGVCGRGGGGTGVGGCTCGVGRGGGILDEGKKETTMGYKHMSVERPGEQTL